MEALMAQKLFIATVDCMVQRPALGVNLSLKRGQTVNSDQDLTAINKYVVPHVKGQDIPAPPPRKNTAVSPPVDSVRQQDPAIPHVDLGKSETEGAYDDLNRDELIKVSQEKGIKGGSRMTKLELLKVISETDKLNAGALG